MASISESMSINGFYGAILVQASTGYILVGNHRFREAVRQGADKIPVFWADVDDEEALRIMLADNKTADEGTYDETVLEELLASLDSLEGTGYGLASLQEQLERDHEASADLNGDGEVPDDAYEPAWAVIINCTSEEEQKDTYEKLADLGFENLRLVAV
jgi:ParB-like chromosome segregation protein Spo0J